MANPEIRRAEPTFDEYAAGRGAALLRSAWLLTGDRQQAVELVGTALGKAFQHWKRVGEEDGLYDAYVRRVMMATYLARWRHHWVPGDLVYTGVTGVVGDSGADSDDDTDDDSETDNRGPGAQRLTVQEALAVLSRPQRAVVVLRFFEGLTEAQTAEALDWSVAAVRRRTAHALKALGGTALLAERVWTGA